MPDRKMVIGHLNDCMEASRRDNMWVFVRKDIIEVAIALLKEQEQTINELEEKLRLLEYGDQDILQSGMMPAT